LHCVKLIWIWIIFIRIFPFLKIYWDLKILFIILTGFSGDCNIFRNIILIKLNNFLICILRVLIIKSASELIAFRWLWITVQQFLIILKHQMNFRLTLISFMLFSFKHILFSYEILILSYRVKKFKILKIV
jgi:hypothetical protein